MIFSRFFKSKPKRVFLDYASTTPISNKVRRAMDPYFQKYFFNPGALYKEAVEVRKVLDDSRAKVSKVLNIQPAEVFFTGSGTESNNIAIQGVYNEALKKGISKPHVITSCFEHPAVLEVCKHIERNGGEVTYLNPDTKGIISPENIQEVLKENTILISIMYVNNEIGTIQPIKDISRIVKKWKEKTKGIYPYVHTDASQAPNYISVHVQALGVDLMTLDGSKIYGPKGVGVLVVKKRTAISAITFGGGQEQGLRPATENIAGIVGFTVALVDAVSLRDKEYERIYELSQFFLNEIKNKIPQAELNGHREKRIPNNINICIKKLDAEFAVLKLDALGVACAHVTSCKSGEENSSYVIESLGKKECASSSLRFTLGRHVNKKDIEYVVSTLKKVLASSVK